MTTLRNSFGHSRLVWASGIAAIVVACSSRDGFDDGSSSGFDVNDASADCTERKCSRDLRSVLRTCADGREELVETCRDDQGCGGGACVEACESARLSKGSMGCSFWTLPPDDDEYARGACFVAMVANTWSRAITLQAEYGADSLDISKSTYTATKNGDATTYTPLTGALPAGEVALVFLAGEDKPASGIFTPCPPGVVPALTRDPIAHGTAKTRAFHLTTDAPASAYSIFPYGGADSYVPSATLLLPETTWERNYLAVSAATLSRFGKPGDVPRTIQIVASQDDTRVEMLPKVGIVRGLDVEQAMADEPKTWTLSRGQVLQITQRESTTGSPIVADKPVGLFGGSACAYVPSEIDHCDMTQQQIAPFAQWGSEYALVPFAPRIDSLTSNRTRELVPWALVGAVDGTILTYEPERPFGAPETLSSGEVATFFTESLAVVKSQDAAHPFHAAVYMSGSMFNGGTGVPSTENPEAKPRTSGDPDFVNVVPSDQFLDRYVFFADYTYPDTSLTLVRRKSSNGFMPVELACGGEVEGWEPLGSSGEYEYTWVTLTKGYVPSTFAKGSCGYGRHEAKSEGPFSVTVWGVARDASYGYAGGQGSRPVNSAVPPPVH